ncbi:AMP deaminase [Pelomyxa schiedti]|nr:AMP deaminase [Pelomyxa schiedti]
MSMLKLSSNSSGLFKSLSRLATQPNLAFDKEYLVASRLVLEALAIRKKYAVAGGFDSPSPSDSTAAVATTTATSGSTGTPPERTYSFADVEGVVQAFYSTPGSSAKTPLSAIPTFVDYMRDFDRIMEITSKGEVVSFCSARLQILEYQFRFHKLLNSLLELQDKKVNGQDFMSTPKVDTHVHLAAAMTEKQMLEFIKEKLKSPEVVIVKNGTPMKLAEVFQHLNIDTAKLNVHSLDVRAGSKTFHRFDKFNECYNLFGDSDLRTIFLKTANQISGKYFAEITHQVFNRLQETNTKAEFRMSIYGRSPKEWDELALWVKTFNLHSPCNRWMIQIPRLFNQFCGKGITSFSQYMDNIFLPLFEVTANPSSHPLLEELLQDISGFDSVDDESKPDGRIEFSSPSTWNTPVNPPYLYYMYYMYANIASLNAFRAAKGLSIFDYRPHSGESGSEKHLSATYLTAKHINHGINLAANTSLQYLYYLTQIGLAVSPLSNNSLFLNYSENPFPVFFKRGLNVSLSTDDPLQFHSTQSPLIEEYAVASRRWRFNDIDMDEIARNSVIQSGFPQSVKEAWLKSFRKPTSTKPSMRLSFRQLLMDDEIAMIKTLSTWTGPSPPVIRGSIKAPRKDLEDVETATAISQVSTAFKLRSQYMTPLDVAEEDLSIPCIHIFKMHNGIMQLFESQKVLCSHDEVEMANMHCVDCNRNFCKECCTVLHKSPASHNHRITPINVASPMFSPVQWTEFVNDYKHLVAISCNGPAHSFTSHRLSILRERFRFHRVTKDKVEEAKVKESGIDFYNVTKVDTHVHANRAMSAEQLYNFIIEKLKTEGDRVVFKDLKGEKNVSLRRAFVLLGLDPDHLSRDALGVMSGEETFERFEVWLAKYDPFGKPELRNLFLRVTENDIEGAYLGELISTTVFKTLSTTPSNKTELRGSISGGDLSEWDTLAKWVIRYNLLSPNNKWSIPIPRVYGELLRKGKIHNFQESLHNIFQPLFEATQNPDKHPELTVFLQNVGGFDTIGDEHTVDASLDSELPLPQNWTSEKSPPYGYWLYYLYANIRILNYFRSLRGMNVFTFRPHCGQCGEVFHLAAGYLLSDGITHGTNLEKSPVLQYLYYLSQIGISCCPLSESSLYTRYEKSPFNRFFEKGLVVTLSTDNPMQLHLTSEPLLEEYATAAQMFKLSTTDQSELALNSVIASSFSAVEKEKWIGSFVDFPESNDITMTNVPTLRLEFRYDSWLIEMTLNDLL